jgi:predicted nucleic acid-binding protein
LVVSNTSPLVYLAALGDFDFLRELFSQIAIPQAVHREIAAGGVNLPVARAVEAATASWLSLINVTDISEAGRLQETGLHPGESEAIVLATELSSHALLMDDSDAIRVAAARGANIIRTPGIYRMAKDRHLIPAVGPKLDGLRKAGFWLREEHYRMILRSLGE